MACDSGIIGCIRNEDSLACQPPSAFSLLACIHRYILFHRSTLTCIFACGAASFDRPITCAACDHGIIGCIRNEDSLACQPFSAFSLLACIHRYILCHRASLACIFACGAASCDRPITRVACDRGIVGCIRNEDSLACQPPSAFSLLACIHRYILFHRSTLACIFACGAASFDGPITRVACISGIVGCIIKEDSLAYQPPSAFSLLACIHRYILCHRASLACISLVVQHLSIGPSLAWLTTAVS